MTCMVYGKQRKNKIDVIHQGRILTLADRMKRKKIIKIRFDEE